MPSGKRGLNAFAKSIDPCQPVQSAQAGMGQNFLLFVDFFSSPEHNVLRGSYCDRSSSVVRPSVRPSICLSVNNFFKNLLLQNQKANLDKTWQECSLGEALKKLLKEFNSNKNSGCHGNKMAENGKNL